MTWRVMGSLDGGEPEEIDEFDTRKEAAENLREYRIAFSSEWRLFLRWVESDSIARDETTN